MTTETIDRLYLELSQVTTAKTKRELELESTVKSLVEACSGVVARCSDSGYVGTDGQFLKVVVAAISKASP